MSISRIYQAIPLTTNAQIQLDTAASHHVARVLRAKINDKLILFNNEGKEFLGSITEINKKHVFVILIEALNRQVESPLNLCLAQGISRGEKMDFTIQKAVELGVKKIVPLFTERCNVKLSDDRKERRFQHWQSIVISACEQSGRSHVPLLEEPQKLSDWIKKEQKGRGFVLSPTGQCRLKDISLSPSDGVILLIGPEGGLTEFEINQASSANFLPLSLGPRILRTETAAIAALSALQCAYGDLGS